MRNKALLAIFTCALVANGENFVGTPDGKPRLFPKADGTIAAPQTGDSSPSGWENTPEIQRAREFGACAMLTLEVLDQDGVPIDGAEATADFSIFGRGIDTQRGRTDSFGKVSFKGTATWSVSLRVEKEGWFGGGATYLLQAGLSPNSIRDGRWMPWNPTIVLRLKKKSAQAFGFVDSVRIKGSMDHDEWIFDPLASFGNANPDDSNKRGTIALKPSYQARVFRADTAWHSSLSLSFSFPGDGVLPFLHDGTSDRTEPRFATESGYIGITNFILSGHGGNVQTNTWPGAEAGMVFRISKDAETHFYGVIYSIRSGEKNPHVDLDYSLNTNSNDRNLFIDLHSRLNRSLGRRIVSSASTVTMEVANESTSESDSGTRPFFADSERLTLAKSMDDKLMVSISNDFERLHPLELDWIDEALGPERTDGLASRLVVFATWLPDHRFGPRRPPVLEKSERRRILNVPPHLSDRCSDAELAANAETNAARRAMLLACLQSNCGNMEDGVQAAWLDACERIWICPPYYPDGGTKRASIRREEDGIPSSEALLEWFAENESFCESVRSQARTRLERMKVPPPAADPGAEPGSAEGNIIQERLPSVSGQ